MLKLTRCVRTQLHDMGFWRLDYSKKKGIFVFNRGSKIKSNNSNNINTNNIINMEMIYNVIQTTLNSFDFAFCIIVNILTYLIINIINSRNGNIDINMWNKRLVLLLCIIIVGSFYYFTGSDIKLVLNSSIITPVFWSWVIKPICRHFKLDYKQLNLFE